MIKTNPHCRRSMPASASSIDRPAVVETITGFGAVSGAAASCKKVGSGFLQKTMQARRDLRFMCAAWLALVVGASPAWSQDIDPQRIVSSGSAGGATACVTCHGATLAGNPALKAPPLAGKPASYILARLAHYAGPDGHNALMKAVATALTLPEREAVAGYISRLRPAPDATDGHDHKP